MEYGDVRAEMAHELGCKLDDMLESAKVDSARNEGASEALRMASKRLTELTEEVDRELDAGNYAEIDSPLAVAANIKRFLIKACAILESGVVSASNHRLVCQGRAQALELVVGNLKKMHDFEKGRAELRKASESEDRARPGLPLKERRRQGELAEVQALESAPLRNDSWVRKSKKAKES